MQVKGFDGPPKQPFFKKVRKSSTLDLFQRLIS